MLEGERRLAAIMFTDIVGYTSLTQRDEQRSMELLRTHNSMLRPIFKRHHGREIKTIGDAFLVEFGSALDAVLCAVEVQETLSNYDKSVASDADRLKLRIGVHLGDVIYADGDVFGDAVNIASRIQPLAEPGGICVSEQVYAQVRNKIPYELVQERVHLKNVSYAVDVYHIVLPWEPRPTLRREGKEGGAAEDIPTKKRLAILPMVNLTHDPQDEYFADGMTEELITALSSVRDMRVIGRTSVMRYKGTTKGISEIARELNVGSVVEGSIRKLGNRVRITIQLVDGSSEAGLMGANYDREFQDIFAVQSEIAAQVARALRAKLRSIEKRRIERKPTRSVDAYSLYLKGRFALHRRTKPAMDEAISFFEQAISIDDKYARSYVGLADSYLLMGSYGYSDAKEAYSKAKEYVSRSLSLDDDLAEAHVSLGFLLETYYYDFLGARREFERAISLAPSYAQARHWYAINLAIFDQLEQAVTELERAREADPLSAQISTVLGGFYLYLNRNQDALLEWNKALRSNPENAPIYLNRAIYYAKLGEKERALADMSKAMELSSNAPTVRCVAGYVEAVLGDRPRAEKTLEEVLAVSKAEYVSPFYLAILYAGLGRKDECLAALDRSVEDRSAEMESLLHDQMFESIRAEPVYREILRRAGIPGPRPLAAARPQSDVMTE